MSQSRSVGNKLHYLMRQRSCGSERHESTSTAANNVGTVSSRAILDLEYWRRHPVCATAVCPTEGRTIRESDWIMESVHRCHEILGSKYCCSSMTRTNNKVGSDAAYVILDATGATCTHPTTSEALPVLFAKCILISFGWC